MMLHTKSAFFDTEVKARSWIDAQLAENKNATVDIYETLLQAVMHIDAIDPEAITQCWVATIKWETPDKSRSPRFDETFTVPEAAEYKGVSPRTIRGILRDDSRRADVFPRATKATGKGRPEWRVSQYDLDNWTPVYWRGKRS